MYICPSKFLMQLQLFVMQFIKWNRKHPVTHFHGPPTGSSRAGGKIWSKIKSFLSATSDAKNSREKMPCLVPGRVESCALCVWMTAGDNDKGSKPDCVLSFFIPVVVEIWADLVKSTNRHALLQCIKLRGQKSGLQHWQKILLHVFLLAVRSKNVALKR